MSCGDLNRRARLGQAPNTCGSHCSRQHKKKAFVAGAPRQRPGTRSRHPNRSLSLHFGEMQGDFRKMQGDRDRKLAKNYQISTSWVMVSLLEGAGKSRENDRAMIARGIPEAHQV